MKARHENQRRKLQRRTFMKALGIGLSAPLAYQASQLAVATPGDRPMRLFIYFLPHGVPNEHFEPGSQMDFTAGGRVGILSPLEPYKSRILLPRGLRIDGIDNHAAIRAVLTGVADGEGSDSIDFSVAQAWGVPAHVLGAHPYRAGSTGLDHDTRLVKHGSWVAPITNPADAIGEIFGGAATEPGTANAPSDDHVFRSRALALTEGEVAALQRELSGLTSETNKLQLHLEAIQTLKAMNEGTGGGGIMSSCQSVPSMPTASSMAGLDAFASENLGKVIDGHLEVAANAFVCGAARVITLQNLYANAQVLMDFPGGPGFAKNHHDPLSHSWDAAGRHEFAEVQKWFYSRLVEKFLATLDQPDPADPGRTVLDNTTVLVCSEVADGANHHSDSRGIWIDGAEQPSPLPWFIIGGGGYFKQGEAVPSQATTRDLLGAVAASVGASVPTVGGQSVNIPQELLA